jgi:hypothetical protein
MPKLLLLALFSVTASAQTFDSISVVGTGGASIKTWHGQATVQSVNVELSRPWVHRLDVAIVLAPMYIRQPRSWFGDQFGDGDENVFAVSGSLLARRRFREASNRAALYLEASTGPMWAQRRVPAATSRFNFISQFGAGVELKPQSRMPIVIGYRFGHISNGGYAPRNPGLNVSSLVVGARFRNAMPRRR